MVSEEVYLLIHEDGTLQKVKYVDHDTIQGAEDGYIQIVNISDPNNPTQYSPSIGYIPVSI